MLNRSESVKSAGSRMTNALSVDVEDYFQVSAFEPYIDRETWSDYECRIPRNLNRILELFDQAGARGTFFCLGWVAEKYPALIRQIADLGHEVASHGFSHVQAINQNEQEFEQDVDRTKKLLEDIIGQAVAGYRAASFSITADNEWAHDVLARTGHAYSSSIYPIRHDRYGMRKQSRFPFRAGQSGLIELPLTAVEVAGFRLPCGGGGYFRLMPYAWTKWGISRFNQRDGRPAIFYFHPWELDPEQPRVPGPDRLSRFRHYVNLRGVDEKLRRLLRDFEWLPVREVFAEYLD